MKIFLILPIILMAYFSKMENINQPIHPFSTCSKVCCETVCLPGCPPICCMFFAFLADEPVSEVSLQAVASNLDKKACTPNCKQTAKCH